MKIMHDSAALAAPEPCERRVIGAPQYIENNNN